ncbi:MAG: hypothetical protein JXM70_24235 [Pirellulales bacterium]|nr:hypothetical protein [Pirellulales bacterium]
MSTLVFAGYEDAAATEPVNIGAQRELFVDSYLVDRLDSAKLVMHRPKDEGIAMYFDKPWEGPSCLYLTVLKDDKLFRMYYRGLPSESSSAVTAYAESRDGIVWTKPELGLHKVCGTSRNNILMVDQKFRFAHNFAPLIDTRPDVPPNERFKALAGMRESGLWAFASADGINWRKFKEGPVFEQGAFDSHNVPFWSESEKCYVCYFRPYQSPPYRPFHPHQDVQPPHLKRGPRRVGRTTSKDFIHWSSPVLMEYRGICGKPVPIEQIYISNTLPYFRAPHIYIALAGRFMEGRHGMTPQQARSIKIDPDKSWLPHDTSDAVLMSSRGGKWYDRTFMESFIRPGIGLENWVSRTNYPAANVVQTGPNEMSIYVSRHYGQDSCQLRRYSLRLDGFVSVVADYNGGQMVTKPLTFTGKALSINYSTSAAGSIRVEIQSADGKPLPGYTMKDCETILGDQIERTVTWKNSSNVSKLAGKPIRLRFIMKDADLYAIRFVEEKL